MNLGRVYYAEKKWTQAEKEFETAVSLDPSSPALLSAYADFLVSRQQAPKAIALAQQFVNAHPDNAQGHVILGALQFNSKNSSAAQVEFERAIQIDPKNVQGYLRMGGVYREMNQTDAAIGQYQKALDLQPGSARLITFVGNLYLEKNDLETARMYYARALEADPNFAVANANMAWVDAQEGKDLDVALGMAQKAKSLMPEVATISDTLAWVMYKKGRLFRRDPSASGVREEELLIPHSFATTSDSLSWQPARRSPAKHNSRQLFRLTSCAQPRRNKPDKRWRSPIRKKPPRVLSDTYRPGPVEKI